MTEISKLTSHYVPQSCTVGGSALSKNEFQQLMSNSNPACEDFISGNKVWSEASCQVYFLVEETKHELYEAMLRKIMLMTTLALLHTHLIFHLFAAVMKGLLLFLLLNLPESRKG